MKSKSYSFQKNKCNLKRPVIPMENFGLDIVPENVKEAETASDKPATLKVYSYDDAMELTGNGRYNYLLLTACSVISHAVALDLFGFGLIVAASTCDLNLTMETMGLLSSIPFAGIFFAFPWGYFADTCGRRKALIWSTGVGFVFAALSSFSSTWYMMAVLKFIGCSFSVAAFGITMTYLGECTGSERRSQYLQIMNSVNLASEAVSFLLALFILPLDFASKPLPWLNISYRPWRLLTLLMALPLGLGAVMMITLHESPKFLANKGREKKALDVLEDIYKRNGGEGIFPVKILSVPQSNDEYEKSSFWSSIVKQSVPIFRPPLLSKTAQLFYLLLVICSTNNVFVMWFPTIVNSLFISINEQRLMDVSFCNRIFDNVTAVSDGGLKMELCNDVISYGTMYSGIGYGVFYTVANLLVSSVAHHRRLILLIIFIISIISCIALNLVHHPVANLIFFVLIQGTSIGIGIGGSYFVDMFPTSYSALATSLGLMVGRVGSFAGVNLIGLVLEKYCSITFYSWAGFVFSGVVVALFLPSDKLKSCKATSVS